LLFIAIARNSEDPKAQKAPPLDLKATLRDVLRDRTFWQFAFALTFVSFTTGVYTLGTPFWAKYTLNASPQAPSFIFGTVFVVAIVSVPFWGRLVHKWGIKRTWLWAVAVMMLSAIELGLASNLIFAVIGAAIAGVGLGGIKVCFLMIMARQVDESMARTGHRREGVYYSLSRFIGKLSKILEALSLVLLGLLFGYVSGEDPGPHPGDAFRFLMNLIPLVFLSLGLMLSRRLPFEEKA
jgi:GPH family glycoside/pentoside/hexuronide:cation symporter